MRIPPIRRNYLHYGLNILIHFWTAEKLPLAPRFCSHGTAMTPVICLDERNNGPGIRVMILYTIDPRLPGIHWEYQDGNSEKEKGRRRPGMWFYRFIFCLFQGHSYIDITFTRRPYKYCLHCGKIKEPVAILKIQNPQLRQAQ
jgi:hypothetical protein